ncbi:inactive hydroxysteroid dehydrogenase-like protein 1 [Pelodytes ibericus]
MELVTTMKTALFPVYQVVRHAYRSHLEILAAVGAWYTFRKGLSIIPGCYTLLNMSSHMLRKTAQVKQYGHWAVVTGATDGIGKAYAEELANHGMNIILISRNPEKLQRVSEDIARTYGVKTRFIVADFSEGREVYSAIKDGLEDVDVAVLVNNAGVLYDCPQYVADVPEDRLWEIINVNIAAVTMMVRIVLPGMVQRKKGAIINVSSGSASVLWPYFSVYSATKAFVDYFSQALHYEYASKGIFIQNLIPLFVATNMISPMNSYLLRESLLVPSAKDYGRQAVRTIGVSRRTTGYWSHAIQHRLMISLPEWAWITFWRLVSSKLRRDYLASNR